VEVNVHALYEGLQEPYDAITPEQQIPFSGSTTPPAVPTEQKSLPAFTQLRQFPLSDRI
jgi:hypothetical protein